MDSLAILCRTVQLAPTSSGEMMYMPGGLQTITPASGGIGQAIQVLVDPTGAAALEEQRAALLARGKQPYFDFNHADAEASFWPTGFFWRPAPEPGIYCRGTWSAEGKAKVEGRAWRQFSPVFHVDNKRAQPARIVCRADAKPNMGGLVNDPAFHAILPLWAKHAPGAHPDHQTTIHASSMTPQVLAALRAKITGLEHDISALEAQHHPGDSAAASSLELRTREAELRAAQAELRAAEAQLETGELKARARSFEEADLRRRIAEAKKFATDMVARGAIAGRDDRTIAEVERNMTDNPAMFAPIYAKWSGQPALGGRLTPLAPASRIQVSHADPRDIYSAMASICAKQNSVATLQEKALLARDLGAIYAAEFRGDHAPRVLDAPIMAADSTIDGLGTVAGSLVTLRTLELLKAQFPALSRFSSDFSDQPAQFNQTIITRTVAIPDVQTYNTSTGWSDSTTGTTDVPVTINQHKGVPITFGENTLASTARRLFDEFAPAAAYALGKNMVDHLYANITDANFPNNTVKATANFARADVIAMGTALTLRGVPQGDAFRTLLLYPTVFAKLAQDTALVTFAGFQRPEMFEQGREMTSTAFPFPVHGFSVHEAVNLPTNDGNITGFGCSKSALIVATRLPNDYSQILPGASHGNVSVVTLPDLGISVLLVEYVDHKLGKATRRISLMYGTAAGQGAAGQLLKANTGTGSSQA